MREFFSFKFLSFFVIFLSGYLFVSHYDYAAAAGACCVYYEGDEPSEICLNITTNQPADCSLESGIYSDNLKGGYSSESGECIDVPGFYAAAVGNDDENCAKADQLNNSTGFLVKLSKASANGVKKQIEAVQKNACCYNSDASCKDAPPHVPFIRPEVLGQIESGIIPAGSNLGDFLTCDDPNSTVSASWGGWKEFAGNCADLFSNGIKPCSSAESIIEKPTAPVIDTAKILKAEAASTLNPMKFKTGAAGVNDFIGRMIAAMTFTMGSLLLLFYVYAGVLWMTSAGSSERVGKAKQIAIWSTLGVIVVLASYAIVTILFKFAG